MAAFDDHYEERLAAGRPLAFEEIFAEGLVQNRYSELVRFLADYPEAFAIRDHLMTRVASHYEKYVTLTKSEEARVHLDTQLRIAMLDSAGFTLSFLYAVALFNGRSPSDEAVQQFTNLGILGKLADDGLDFWEDLSGGQINMLRGVLHRHPEEEAKILATMPSAATRGVRWWRFTCPESFKEFATLIGEQRAGITSKPLLLICDLMLAQMTRGRTAIQSVPVGLRV
jgi:hypothetical protein